MNFFVLKVLILIQLGKIKFHWLFSESHHGKGEHDGHGATVKATIRFFVLGGKKKILDTKSNLHSILQKTTLWTMNKKHMNSSTLVLSKTPLLS
jgi:hypothetical protein